MEKASHSIEDDLGVIANSADGGKLLDGLGLEVEFRLLSVASHDSTLRGEGSAFDAVLLDGAVGIKHKELSKDTVSRDQAKELRTTHFGHAHLVGGQCTRLVRADDVGAAQGLDTWQVANDSVAFGHFLGSKGKACGDDGGETFRDSSDGECDGNLEVINRSFQSSAMRRVGEVTVVNNPDEDADHGDDFGECVSKVVELALERGLLGYLRADGLVDISDSGLLACEYDDSFTGTVDYTRSLNECERADKDVEMSLLTENRMLIMSCFTAFASATTSVDLCTLTLSPVRIAWSTRKLLEWTERSRQSAGILSPTATDTISPGTSSEAWIFCICPSRSTLASSGEYSFSA